MAILNPYQKFGQVAAYKGMVSNLENNLKSAESRKPEQDQNNGSSSNQMKSETPSDIYLQNKVMTATPEELTLMLYDGVLRFIVQGKTYIEQNNIPKAHESIIKAQNIIIELRSTLDHSYEIAKKLDAMYDFMYNHLVKANVNKSVKALDEVYQLMKELRDTWEEAMKTVRKSRYAAK